MSSRDRARARARSRAAAWPRSNRWVYAGIAAVVGGAVLVAVLLGGGGSDGSGDEVRPVAVTGTALAPYGTADPDPAVGAAIPAVTGTDLLTGRPVEIAPDGRPRVVMLVAHWCPHCRKEVPIIGPDVAANGLPEGVDMVVVSTGVKPDAPNYPPSDWLRANDWPTPVLADDGRSSAAEAFGLTGYPYFLFVGADGKVASRTVGEIPISEFRARIDSIAG